MTADVKDNSKPKSAGSGITESESHLRWRYLKDVGARIAVLVGGSSVLLALMLIFVLEKSIIHNLRERGMIALIFQVLPLLLMKS